MDKRIKISVSSILFSLLLASIVYFIICILFNIWAFSGNKYARSYLEVSDFTSTNIQANAAGYVVNSNEPKLIRTFDKEMYIASVLLDLRNLPAKEVMIQVYYTNSVKREYNYFDCVRQNVSAKNAIVKVPLNVMADSIRFDVGSDGDSYKLKKVIINPHVSDMIKYSFSGVDYMLFFIAFSFGAFFLHLYPKCFILVRGFVSNIVAYLNSEISFDFSKLNVVRFKQIYRLVFFVVLYLYFCKYYIHIGTMLGSKMNWIYGYNDFFLYCGVIFAVISVGRMILDQKWLYSVLALSLLSCFFLSNQIAHNDIFILINICFVVSCYDMPGKWILRTFILSVGIIVLVDVALSLCDIIPNLQYHSNRGVRNAFGANYPTDFAAAVLYSLLSVWVLFKKKNLLLLVMLSVFIFVQCKYTFTRNSIVCSAFFIIFIFYFLITERYSSVKCIRFVNGTIIYNMSLLSFLLFAALTIGLAYCYDPSNGFFSYIDHIFSSRISISHKVINEYGLSPFGKFFIMFGFGSTTSSPPFYNFLDISYCNILLRLGIVSLVITAVLCIFLVKRAIKWNVKKLVLVMFIVSLHCVVEHHFLDTCYNVFLLLAFADFTDICKGKSDKRIKDETWYYVI